MNRYTIEHNGSRYVVEAETPDEATNAVMSQASGGGQGGGQAQPSGGGTDTYVDPLQGPMPGITNADIDTAAKNAPGELRTFARRAANAATIGNGDRLAAGAKTLFGEGSYADNLNAVRGETSQLVKQNPKAAFAGDMVGGAVLPLGAAGAAAKGATLAGKVGYGALTGGAIGGAYGVGDAPDWTNPASTAGHVALGAGTGAFIGGGIPLFARGAGAAYRGIADRLTGADAPIAGMSRPATNILSNAVDADGAKAVSARLGELGEQGMLPDTGPSLLGLGQGIAQRPGDAKSILVDALRARDAGTQGRVRDLLDSELGPAQSPVGMTNTIKEARSAITSPMFEKAFASGTPVDTTEALAFIGDALNTAKGPEKAALQAARDMLMVKRPAPNGGKGFVYEPETNPEAVHNTKVAIGGLLKDGNDSLGIPKGSLNQAQGSAKQVYGKLVQALEDQVPGYKAANATSREYAGLADNIKTGTESLGGGASATRPDDFARYLRESASTPAAVDAVKLGQRGVVDAAVGTKANDLQAVRSALQGENGWNAAKLAATHGDAPVERVGRGVGNEQAMRDTNTAIVGGSQTEPRAAAREALKDANPVDFVIPKNASWSGMAGHGLEWLLRKGAKAATTPDNTARDIEIARALARQGGDADALVQALSAARQKQIGNAATGQKVGDYASLVSALAQAGAARHLTDQSYAR